MPKFLRHMNRPPAFQWYGKDWLTSKKRAVMDLEQQGAYVNLLSHCWDTDDCSLPNDDTMLAALSELRDRWSDRAAPLKACFVEHPKRPGHITNLRLLEEFTKLLNYRREKQAAGHVGGVKSGQSRRNVKGNHSEADLKLTLDSASSKVEAKRTSSSSSSSSSSVVKNTPTPLVLSPEELAERFNTIPGVKLVKLHEGKLPETIRKKAQVRIHAHNSLSFWHDLVELIQQSSFLTGKVPGRNGDEPFRISFDWLMGPKNFDKVLAGTYSDQPAPPQKRILYT